MPQPGSPPLRVLAALAIVVYAGVMFVGVTSLEPLDSAHRPGPHCTVCGCVESVSREAELPAPVVHRLEPSGVVLEPQRRLSPFLLARDASGRAPPVLTAAI